MSEMHIHNDIRAELRPDGPGQDVLVDPENPEAWIRTDTVVRFDHSDRPA